MENLWSPRPWITGYGYGTQSKALCWTSTLKSHRLPLSTQPQAIQQDQQLTDRFISMPELTNRELPVSSQRPPPRAVLHPKNTDLSLRCCTRNSDRSWR